MRRADLFDKDQFEGTTPQGEIDYWKQRAANAATPEERATIEHNRAELAEYAEYFRRHYFVSCWNMAPDENIAMWERYTSGPESVVIRSRYSTFAKQFHYGCTNIGKVTYINYSLDAPARHEHPAPHHAQAALLPRRAGSPRRRLRGLPGGG